ncbi:hypothetical protein ATEIFO6365_0004035900 [Aspergillus terreus]|uniref:Uncharacterized protein n=1 Tax=Aspergillus terreus TaxID=33178 RepID=A0A5M3YQG3_ASPTE|nr:hypothetical protein ATETN484_0002038400 [Aspergillus terreus]GFF15240.1 hypothetical protein ATEIFO6365_0004035900 [Aspergillus terreus]
MISYNSKALRGVRKERDIGTASLNSCPKVDHHHNGPDPGPDDHHYCHYYRYLRTETVTKTEIEVLTTTTIVPRTTLSRLPTREIAHHPLSVSMGTETRIERTRLMTLKCMSMEPNHIYISWSHLQPAEEFMKCSQRHCAVLLGGSPNGEYQCFAK